jgi:hypothetical protein
VKTIEETTPDMHNEQISTSAWRMDYAAIMASATEKEREGDCTVDAWLVKAPWAHPLWPVHMLALIHLREDTGAKPVIRLEGATHEIIVYAVAPEGPIVVDGRNNLLTPVNFVGQFIAANDEAARDRLRCTVDDIVQGFLNPDTDGLRQWVARFGDNSMKRELPALVIGGVTGAVGIRQLLEAVTGAGPEPTPGCECPYCQSARHVH